MGLSLTRQGEHSHSAVLGRGATIGYVVMSAQDRAVVDAVLAGDRDAYRVLVEREAGPVRALCMAVLRDSDEADDVAQEAFVHAYRALAGYRGDGSFGAWIGRIAARLAVARAAQRRRAATTAIDPDAFVDERANPERSALRSEHDEAVRRAIAQLPAEQREVVARRYFEDMSVEQIATLIGVPTGTVKSRLHRGLARLRRHEQLRSIQ